MFLKHRDLYLQCHYACIEPILIPPAPVPTIGIAIRYKMLTASSPARVAFAAKVQTKRARTFNPVRAAADRPVWLPGSPPAKHLDGVWRVPWCSCFTPGPQASSPVTMALIPWAWLPLATLPCGAYARLQSTGPSPIPHCSYYREAELVHGRWAMLGCAGVLAQEIVRPDVFFYTAPQQIELPFNAAGIIAFQIFVMHWTELRRISDIIKPGSVDQDPIFTNNKLPPHEPSYPGGIFAPFVPGDLADLKVKEIKNVRFSFPFFLFLQHSRWSCLYIHMTAGSTGHAWIRRVFDGGTDHRAKPPGCSWLTHCGSPEHQHVWQGVGLFDWYRLPHGFHGVCSRRW